MHWHPAGPRTQHTAIGRCWVKQKPQRRQGLAIVANFNHIPDKGRKRVDLATHGLQS